MTAVRPLLVAAWRRWKMVAHAIGDLQARLLLSLFYFVVLGPFALGLKAAADPLGIRSSAAWRPRPAPEADVWLAARRQF
jgi:hypothetical protein